jgi:ATP-binding cassette subfamily A (ABC1) protein 1
MSQYFGISMIMQPYPCWKNDKFIFAISRLLPLFMVISWIYSVAMMVKDIVYEKEKRLKEFMRVMGLSNGIHWLTWFITSFAVMYFITFLLALLLKYGEILQHSDITVLFVFFACFSASTICQCFLFSVFFNKANIASVLAGIFFYILYLPYTILINYQDVLVTWHMILASLSSTVAFSYGCDIIATFELQNQGILLILLHYGRKSNDY